MLTILSVWPYAVVMIALLGLAAVMARSVPFYRMLLSPSRGPNLAAAANPGRFESLDGLRGFLATGVFFCHSTTSYFYYTTGTWTWPPSRFFTAMGQVPVILFFMITGFLFWNKAIKKPVKVASFYYGRFLRIMPLYGLLIALILIVVGVQSHFVLHESRGQLIKELLTLAVPGLNPSASINGVDVSCMLMMSWTLWYEVAFYLVFPVLALFTGRLRFLILCAAGMLLYGLEYALPSTVWNFLRPTYCVIFLFGMAAAQYLPALPKVTITRRRIASGIALVCLAVTSRAFSDNFLLLPYLLMFITFVCIAYGADFFGVLRTVPARLLGTISYSVYLLHMAVLYVVLRCVNAYLPIAGMSPARYWILTGIAALLVVIVAAIAYRWFEHPFLGVARAAPAPLVPLPASGIARAPSAATDTRPAEG